MKKESIVVIILIALTFSCDNMEQVIDLEIPPHESVLVLNGRLDTDKEIKVLLSKSVGAFETNKPSMVNDANLTLYEDGIALGLSLIHI